MPLTTPHKLFHVAVFGALVVVLGGAFLVIRARHGGQFTFSGSNKDAANERDSRDRGQTEAQLGDYYGAETPEETFAMFLAALKVGDAELASRYFTSARRESWERALAAIDEGGGLDTLHEELSFARAGWMKKEETREIASYVYQGKDGRTGTLVFTKNDASGIWKIRDL